MILESTQQVQCDAGLWKQSVPEMQWEKWIDAAKCCNKMVLECAYGAFSSIPTVRVGWCLLEIHLLWPHEFFASFGAFVVESLDLWFMAKAHQFGVQCFACCDDAGCCPARHWLGKNGIAVIVVEDCEIFVAVPGW